eukprot:2941391-Amphidinium_carterae.1
MYEYFHDDNEIGETESLHEGVLYWMSLDDIKDFEQRAYSTKDPDALQQHKQYLEHNRKLDTKMREEYEK